MSSTVLTTDILSRIERLLIKIRRRSLGEGCGSGTMTAGIDFRIEYPGFDECERGFFSFGGLSLKTNEDVNLTSHDTNSVFVGSCEVGWGCITGFCSGAFDSSRQGGSLLSGSLNCMARAPRLFKLNGIW